MTHNQHTTNTTTNTHEQNKGGEVSYAEHIQPLQEVAPPGLRFVLVSATLPQHTADALAELFPGLTPAFGPGLHRTAPGAVCVCFVLLICLQLPWFLDSPLKQQRNENKIKRPDRGDCRLQRRRRGDARERHGAQARARPALDLAGDRRQDDRMRRRLLMTSMTGAVRKT